MAWNDLVATMDTGLIAVFGVPVTFTPQDGSGPQQISGIIQTPAMAEDYVPGSLQGPDVVRLFVYFASLVPSPQHGDTIAINGRVYNVEEVSVDVAGGAVLNLRTQ